MKDEVEEEHHTHDRIRPIQDLPSRGVECDDDLDGQCSQGIETQSQDQEFIRRQATVVVHDFLPIMDELQSLRITYVSRAAGGLRCDTLAL